MMPHKSTDRFVSLKTATIPHLAEMVIAATEDNIVRLVGEAHGIDVGVMAFNLRDVCRHMI